MLNRNQIVMALAATVALLFIISASRVHVLLSGATHENGMLHVEMSSSQFKELKTMLDVLTMLSIVLYSIALGIFVQRLVARTNRENTAVFILNFVIAVLMVHYSFKLRSALCKRSHANGKMTVSMSESEHKSYKTAKSFLVISHLVIYSLSLAGIVGRVALDMGVGMRAAGTGASSYMD